MATMNNKSNASGHTKIVIITTDDDIVNRIINNAQQTSNSTYVFNDMDFLNHLVNPVSDIAVENRDSILKISEQRWRRYV